VFIAIWRLRHNTDGHRRHSFLVRVLQAALTETGILTVTGIPGLADLRRSALLGTHVCSRGAGAAKTVTFDDGTSRTTLAAVTSGLDSAEDMKLGDVSDDELCPPSFRPAVAELRALVADVATSFMARVGDVFDTADVALLWNMDGTKKYSSFEDIARSARHLEHFHSYRNNAPSRGDGDAMSIEMHADQGLFIAFIPGFLVEDDAATGTSSVVEGASAGNFYLQARDGSVSTVDFGTGDMLVFMLGDGVNQYFNDKFQGPELYAAPHAMSMPSHEENQARLWYGRMFLPPDEALNERQGKSFGRVREMMIDAITNSETGTGTGIGCSRKLAEVEQLECGDDAMYCWMRCMNHTADASPAACEGEGKTLRCLSQRLQIWRPQDSHGDYNPTCTDVPADTWVTPEPKIPERDAAACADGFDAFVGKDEYDNAIELEEGKHWLLWSVKDGLLHAKMAYNDTVGWLALGAANVGAYRSGMMGAHIVMGIIDTPTADDPRSFGSPWVGTGVNEYIIDEQDSAFRHWSTPYSSPALHDAALESTECYTAMTFATASISGWDLNLTQGSNNSLIWGSHTTTFLKGYHGPLGRGNLEIVLNAAEEPTSSAAAARVSFALLVSVALLALL